MGIKDPNRIYDTEDLALIRYDKIFPGHYSLYTGSLLPETGAPLLSVIMVGYGTIGSVFPDHWTDNGTGNGVKRWGSQQIDRTVNDGSKFYMDFKVDLTGVKNMYETTFLVVPEISESDYQKVVEKFVAIIKDFDGEIINRGGRGGESQS